MIDDLTIELPLLYEEVFTPAEKTDKLSTGHEESTYSFEPLAKKIFLSLEKPSLDSSVADFERIAHKLNVHVEIELNLLSVLEKVLRDAEWHITVTLADCGICSKITKIESEDTTGKNYGIALDIGTTTVVVYLVDLNNGKTLKAKASYNKQIAFGDDVITRIMYAEDKDGLNRLCTAIKGTINNLINKIAAEENILLTDINAVYCAGNTTMMHLFLNIPPCNIRKEPYIPVFNKCPVIKSRDTGLNINPEGIISCAPGVASYVGGDITAGVLACGMDNYSTISLLVDLGTNGEIVLGNKDWMLCCACSAGPAFEGVGIKCGMHAVNGAIERIELIENKSRVKYSTIDNMKPRGICGSGLLDIPAELLKNNVINRAGKFVPENSSLVRKSDNNNEYEFVIVSPEESATGEKIVITESDIQNLMRSKGAVFLGIEILLKQVGLKFEDIEHIYVSGGFGTHIDIEKAIIIGLFPDISRDKFSFIGNSSITGAKICLLSRKARERIEVIARKMTYIELSTDPLFMSEYTSTLFLPHTRLDLFPSVEKVLQYHAKG